MSHDLLYPTKGYSPRERPLMTIVVGVIAIVQLIASTTVLLITEPTTPWSAEAFVELVEGPELHRFRSVTESDGVEDGPASTVTGAVDRKRGLTLQRMSAPMSDEGLRDVVDPAGPGDADAKPSRRFRMTTIAKGFDIYIKIPPTDRPEGVPLSKSWIHYDYGTFLPDLDDIADRVDVNQVYKNVRAGGYTTIRGLRVRSISAEIDCTPYYRAMAEAMAKRTGEPIDEVRLQERPVPSVTAKAYVTDGGQLVRLVATATVAEGQRLESVRTTHDILDAGKPVRIDLPDEDEILTFSMDDVARGGSEATFQTAAAGVTSVAAPGAMSGVLNMMM